jgi:hypothetical protein
MRSNAVADADTAGGGLGSKTVAVSELVVHSEWSAPSAVVRLPGVGKPGTPHVRPEFPHMDRFLIEWKPPKPETMHECRLVGFAIEATGVLSHQPVQVQDSSKEAHSSAAGVPISASERLSSSAGRVALPKRDVEVLDGGATRFSLCGIESGALFTVRLCAIAELTSDPTVQLRGEWSASSQLLLPAISMLSPPTFVTAGGNKALVRWRRPVCVECELTAYEVGTCELGETGALKAGADGKPHWSYMQNTELSAAKPEQQVLLKPLQRYVAHVRALGLAKDGKTKLRTEWSANSEPFMIAKRMGGGFGLLQSAEVNMAMARAKDRASLRLGDKESKELKPEAKSARPSMSKRESAGAG